MQQYNISMSGGTENTRYFVSYGLMDQQGVLNIYDDKYQRHTINVDQTTDVAKWLTFGAKVRYTYGFEDHPSGGMSNSGLSAYGGVLKADLPPFMPVYHPDGSFAGQGSITNPVAVGRLGGYEQRKVNDLWVTGKMTIRPVTDFNVNVDFTFNPYSRNIERVITRFMEKRADGTEYVYPWVRDDGVTRQNDDDYYTAFNAYVDYTKNISKNNFKITAGYNQEIKTNKNFTARRLTLIDKDTPMMSLSTGTQTVSDGATSWSVQGVFGRLHYDYAEKYLIDITGRYDGSSKFTKGDRFALFPSIAAGWYISKENFMSGINHILSDLKFRVSYGSLGNQNITGNFPYVPSYAIDINQAYLIDGARGVTTTAPGLVSASLTWEKVTQWNAALDFGLLENRLTGSFDVFTRNTIGMLVPSQPLPGVLGTSAPNTNAADLKTKGWELTLRWDDQIKSAGLNYHVSFVLSDALAEITKYENPTGSLSTYYVGRKIGEIWGYESNGLFQSAEEIAAAPSQLKLFNGTWYPGDVRYVNKNDDNEISNGSNTLDNHGDLSIIGNTTPRYQYGITLGADWKGIDIQTFLQGVGKRSWWPDSRLFGVNGRWEVPARDIGSYWTEDTPDGFLPKMYQSSRGNRQTNTRYLQDASYLRFKQLSVGYTLPVNWTKTISLERVRIYFTGQNIFTWTNLSKLYDPEIIGAAARDTGVASNLTYPVSKTFSFGLDVTF
jgi:TonB-linked SusC/RagA family outer membrane protein